MNQRRSNVGRLAGAMAIVVGLGGGAVASAAVDTVYALVNSANATGGVGSIGAYAYDPTTDTIYTANFNSGNLRKITNVDGNQAASVQVYNTAWQLYLKGGNGNLTGGTPIPSGMLLNPVAIPSLGLAAYSSAFVIDADSVITSGSGTSAVTYPAATQKIYRYNLGVSAIPTDGSAANAGDVFTSVMTLANQQAAAGSTATTGTLGRQYAWSGNGQSIYFIDSNTSANGLGGIFRTNVATGTTTRLMTASSDINTEPAVTSANGVDTIYFRGGTATGNLGGIDKITYDGTTASARTVAVSAAAINDFLELPSGSAITTFSMTSDAAGNLYFNDTSTTDGRNGIYKVDPQGRMTKVVSLAERKVAFAASSVNANTLRMQTRSYAYTGSAGSTFDITQLMYAESSPVNAVAAVNVFATGDFNRDGVVNQADIGLFKSQLTVRGVQKADASDLKYDLNGNGAVDWKDVKILQQFYPIPNGDADMNLSVDYTDLNTMYANYKSTAATWVQGDFTGDNIVDSADLKILADNFTAMLPTAAYIESHYTGDFEADALVAFGLVSAPEPSSAALAVAATAGLLARRRRRRGAGAAS